MAERVERICYGNSMRKPLTPSLSDNRSGEFESGEAKLRSFFFFSFFFCCVFFFVPVERSRKVVLPSRAGGSIFSCLPLISETARLRIYSFSPFARLFPLFLSEPAEDLTH